MGPAVSGFMIMMGTAIMLALIMGSIGGIINGKYRVNLLAGIMAIVGLYVCVSYFLGFFLVVTVGLPPLFLTFLSSSIMVQYLEKKYGLSPIWSILAGLGVSIAIGILFILLGRARLYPFEYYLWVTAGVMLSIMCFYLFKKHSAQQVI